LFKIIQHYFIEDAFDLAFRELLFEISPPNSHQ
jgi:hypothetical protein